MSQHIYTMHLNYDKSYLKTYDSISFDVMINYMLDGIPYLCTCSFTVCLPLFHVLWAGGLNHNRPFVLVLVFDNRRPRAQMCRRLSAWSSCKDNVWCLEA